jgi:hypothetical protein
MSVYLERRGKEEGKKRERRAEEERKKSGRRAEEERKKSGNVNWTMNKAKEMYRRALSKIRKRSGVGAHPLARPEVTRHDYQRTFFRDYSGAHSRAAN